MKHEGPKEQPDLRNKIEEACEGLVYVSETDSVIEAFWNTTMKAPSARELLRELKKPGEVVSESTNTEDFFRRLTAKRNWHTKEQTKTARQFKKLQQLLENELSDICVIRIGKIQIETYVIGTSNVDVIAGIKTFSVET